ncbi:MAG: hypothetical protein IKN72_00295, partial [Clostridia bacterium]|nr:hypothetical protein [Clostridia bacterium]
EPHCFALCLSFCSSLNGSAHPAGAAGFRGRRRFLRPMAVQRYAEDEKTPKKEKPLSGKHKNRARTSLLRTLLVFLFFAEWFRTPCRGCRIQRKTAFSSADGCTKVHRGRKNAEKRKAVVRKA